MAEVLQIEALRAGWGETLVLEDVALSVPERGTLAVLGRNGVGKTTLLATIMGHTRLHAGTIRFLGKDMGAAPVYRRSRAGIGFVPQTRDIFPSLSVEENLGIASRAPGRAAAAPARWNLQRVYDLFPRLAERRAHMGNQISGGEQQMLAIGRALMGNPTLLLMDEPLEGLAPIVVDSLLQAIERLIREDALALVLVEQSARLALQMTQAALVLDRGRVVYSGKSGELLADPQRLAALYVSR